jgi:hypothetical protein
MLTGPENSGARSQAGATLLILLDCGWIDSC